MTVERLAPGPAGVPFRAAWLVALLALAAVTAVGDDSRGQAGASTGPAVEKALTQIQPELIRAHMRFLADDLLEGRGTGTRGHRLAALYVAAEFERLGLDPVGDGGSYLQAVRLARTRPRESECSLVVSTDGQDRALAYGSDFVMLVDPTLPDARLRASVSFVGYGVTAPEQHYDDYAGTDVAGRIVAYLDGAPASFADAPGAFHGDEETKRLNAARHGAVGVLQLGRVDAGSSWEATLAASKQGVMALADASDPSGPPRTPTSLAHLGKSGIRALFDRDTGRWQAALADVGAGRPRSFHLTPALSVRQSAERTTLDSANVVGVLRGSDERLRSEYVVYTAHLDHVGIGEPLDGDAIYNGARDNASGVAGMLAVARAFASLDPRPRRSIVFLATTAEEAGSLGSRYFVVHPPVGVEDVVADVNLDGLAVFWPLRDVAGWGARHSTLGAAVEEAARRLGLEATLPDDDSKVLMSFSDQAAFARKGIPVVWLVYGDKSPAADVDPEALERKWSRAHRPNDDMSQPFDFESSVKLSRAAFLTGLLVAGDRLRPSWREGSFFAGRLRHGR